MDIIIYDFCETLVDFQTGDGFVHFIRRTSHKQRMMYIEKLRKILIKSKLMRIIEKIYGLFNTQFNCYNKKMVLSELKGFTKEEIERYSKEYYLKEIKPHIIKKVFDRMIEESRMGSFLVIISAGYEPYIKHFANEYNINVFITNEFKYDKKDLFTGKIMRKDCFGEEKVKRLYERIPEFNQYSNSTSYSDSESDIPILEIADVKKIISYKEHKKWIEKYDYKEIIWD